VPSWRRSKSWPPSQPTDSGHAGARENRAALECSHQVRRVVENRITAEQFDLTFPSGFAGHYHHVVTVIHGFRDDVAADAAKNFAFRINGFLLARPNGRVVYSGVVEKVRAD
jgi:hypothetical protein